ncbi:MAG TPA: DEAD/DEAH box helicase [Candidatus Methylacidiphilales bacterium]|nr:DEAD/DEAH box helicase [Candidatus Methylacidiphilales bacterium]
MSFQNLGLSDDVIHGVQSMGYLDPTPIQLRAFPIILGGKDLIGSSQTGTGKTAAFALPLLTLLRHHGTLRVLILEPTRELAAQVETAFRDYSRFSDLRTTVIYGGVGYGKQTSELKSGADILVATPGRLLDHLEQGNLKLDTIGHLVLDEADRMLDMGFMPDVRRIINQCPRERQTLLFSATMPPEIASLTEWALRQPEKIEIGARRSPAETVTHALYPVAASQKYDLLLELLKKTNFDSVLVFVRTKHAADRIAAQLKHARHSVAVLHSNRSQNERLEALDGFRNGKYEVMVATDIASRGIDVAGVSHVINYDVPQHPEDYVHRIGRTGRAQAVGDAFTLMTAEEGPDVAAIERFIGQSLPRVKLEDFPYVYSLALDDKARHVVGKAGNIRGGRAGKGYSFGVRRR